MRPVTVHTGRAVPLHRDNVDTDQIVPAEFCKRLTKTGYADALFARWREDPAFVLNRPEHAGASVLVARAAFGSGSSREHAVWALRDGGFAAVIAAGFGDIFRRNALKNGLLAVQLDLVAVDALRTAVEDDPSRTVTVDLVRCEVWAVGGRHPFTIDERARRLLLEGLDDIDLAARRGAEISGHERGRPDWLPAFTPAGEDAAHAR